MIKTYLMTTSIVWFGLLVSLSRPVVGGRNKFSSSWLPLGLQANESAEAPATGGDDPNPFPFFSRGACKEWVNDYNYYCEEHKVTTTDGYVLSMQRIGPKGQVVRTKKQPVLLQHGVFVDGICWMVIKEDSLAFYLADQGYDVWVNNNRGTIYSLDHQKYSPIDERYWNWSVDELAEYDFTATISYVYTKTEQKVHYIGHSMGTLVGFSALASNYPAVKNVRSASMLSPIGYLNHIFSPFAVFAAHLFLGEMGRFIGKPAFNPMKRTGAEVAKIVCAIPGVDCSMSLIALTGPNCCLDEGGMENFLSHETQQTAMKVLVHMSQNIRGGGIRKFDYGAAENMKRYGSERPPKYDMSLIPTNLPMFIAYGGTDSLADFVDVLFLLKEMGNHNPDKIVKKFVLGYAHADFLMATNVVDEIYKPLVDFLKTT